MERNRASRRIVDQYGGSFDRLVGRVTDASVFIHTSVEMVLANNYDIATILTAVSDQARTAERGKPKSISHLPWLESSVVGKNVIPTKHSALPCLNNALARFIVRNVEKLCKTPLAIFYKKRATMN